MAVMMVTLFPAQRFSALAGLTLCAEFVGSCAPVPVVPSSAEPITADSPIDPRPPTNDESLDDRRFGYSWRLANMITSFRTPHRFFESWEQHLADPSPFRCSVCRAYKSAGVTSICRSATHRCRKKGFPASLKRRLNSTMSPAASAVGNVGPPLSSQHGPDGFSGGPNRHLFHPASSRLDDNPRLAECRVGAGVRAQAGFPASETGLATNDLVRASIERFYDACASRAWRRPSRQA
jgi:hypothetical protein